MKHPTHPKIFLRIIRRQHLSHWRNSLKCLYPISVLTVTKILSTKYFPHIKFDHQAKFGCYFSRCIGTYTTSLRIGACVTPRKTPIPYACYHAEYGRSRSNGWCIIMEMLRKRRLTLHVLTFKVTHGQWNRRGLIVCHFPQITPG